MFNKITSKFYHIILIILFCVVSYCLILSLYFIGGKASADEYNPLILFLGIIVLGCCFLGLNYVLKSCSEKQLKITAIIIFAVYFVSLLYWGFNLKYIPSYDLIHIHAEAENMIHTGKIKNVEYFAKYPSQQPLTIFLYFIFKAAYSLGVTDLKSVGILVNICALFISAFFVYRICALYSLRAGMIGLCVFVADPVLYRWVSYYYTDIICIPYMMAGIYLFLFSQKRAGLKVRYFLLLLSGFLIMFGGKIRMTASFALIAIVMHLFITDKFKPFLKKAVFLFAGLICALVLVNSAVHIYGISDDSYQLPVTHWLKLGLNEESYGAYTTADEKDTLAEKTYQDKIQENLDTIEERVANMRLSGIASLYSKKLVRTWGTAAYTESLQYTVEDYGRLYQYTVGNKSVAYNYWMQIYRCTLLVFMVIGVLFAIKDNIKSSAWLFILMFGAVVFYIFWEAKPKYSLCFLPVIYLIAVYTLLHVNRVCESIAVKLKYEDSDVKCMTLHIRRILAKIQLVIMLLTVVTGVLSFSEYVLNTDKQKDIRVSQTSAWTGKIDEIGYEGIKQSFVASDKFNTIEISFLNPDHLEKQMYAVYLLDENENIIEKQQFYSDEIEDNVMHEFSFDKVTADNDKFYIWIKSEQKYSNYIGVNSCRYTLYSEYKNMPDYYPDGCLYIDGNPQNADLTFSVSNQYYGKTMSPYVFAGICVLILLSESAVLFLIICYNTGNKPTYKI